MPKQCLNWSISLTGVQPNTARAVESPYANSATDEEDAPAKNMMPFVMIVGGGAVVIVCSSCVIWCLCRKKVILQSCPGFVVVTRKSYTETPPPPPGGGGECAPLTRPYAHTPLKRPFGTPQKGSTKGQTYFFHAAVQFFGCAGAPAGRILRGQLREKPPPRVKVRPIGRKAA